MDPAQRELRPAPSEPRPSLSSRKRAARAAAVERIAARTTVPLSPAQRARDPLLREPRGSGARAIRAAKATVGSVLVHGAIVAMGFVFGGQSTGRKDNVDQKMTIEVREPPPPPVLPPTPPEVEAKVERPPPRAQKAPPPKAPPPPEPPAEQPKAPPPRVVGLSLESTTEGGGGPSFAVGNTRMGETAGRAENPNDVPKGAPGGEPAPGTNQTASRLPSAGVTYKKPIRKFDRKPPYPPTLKAQTIEADVKVSLSIDATGKVTAVRILTPAAYPEFNEAVRAFAMTEEYEPAQRDGTPIPYSLPFTYRFRLEDE